MKAYLKINVNAIYPFEKKFFLTVQRDYTIAILRPVGHSRTSMYTLGVFTEYTSRFHVKTNRGE